MGKNHRYIAPRVLSRRKIRVSLNGKRNDPEFEMLLAALKS